MTKYQVLKGFRDFAPREAVKRKWLREKLAGICESWGYAPIETPTLEPLEIFRGAIGEDEKLFFKFTDQGDREVALRYDQTVPTCRFVGANQNDLIFPFKRYQIQPAFRAEKPQKGRYREFTQCDADIFGVKTPDADAEVIALSLDIYRQLGFKQAIARINSRALYAGMPYEAIVAIDKLKKIGEEGVIADMVQKGITADTAREYLNRVKSLKPNEEIDIILTYLKNYGFPADWYEFDPTIARSFSYSMGPIWEVVIPETGDASVLGGERYDGLLEKFTGRDIGGTGFAVGFDRTLEAAETLGLVPPLSVGARVLVTVFNPDLQPYSLQLAKMLREKGVAVGIYPRTDEKLDKQLKFADRNSIPYAIIAGPEEQAKNTVKLKNLTTKDQQEVTVVDVIHVIINLLS